MRALHQGCIQDILAMQIQPIHDPLRIFVMQLSAAELLHHPADEQPCCLLPRKQWFSPVNVTTDDVKVVSLQSLFEDYFTNPPDKSQNKMQRPIQIALLNSSGEETSRGFLVSESWLSATALNRPLT